MLSTQSTLQCKGGVSSSTTSVQHPPGWCDGSHSAPERPPHTSLLVERRQSDEANQCRRMIRRPWWSEAMGEFGQDAGVTPLLFSKDILGFIMTTGSQDLSLTSHLKDGAFLQYCVLVTTLGRYDPHRLQGEHPLLVSLTPLPAAT